MAKYDPQWEGILVAEKTLIPDLDDPDFTEKWIRNLINENIRLERLAHDLQQEIEKHVLAEIHPMEDK